MAQWEAYFDEVKRKHAAVMQDVEAAKLLVFEDGATKTIYSFTKPGHPAHPAWITRKVEQRGDSIVVNQIGYFAGDEPSFAQLLSIRCRAERQDGSGDQTKEEGLAVKSKALTVG